MSGKIDLSGSIWALRNVGRSTEWRLLLNGREVATGIISGRTHTRAKPEVFQFEWSIREGDIIELNADKHDSISGDYFGLNMKIMPKF